MKTAIDILNQVSPNRPWTEGGKTDQMIIRAMKKYAEQSIQEAADRIYGDVGERTYESALSVKEDLI